MLAKFIRIAALICNWLMLYLSTQAKPVSVSSGAFKYKLDANDILFINEMCNRADVPTKEPGTTIEPLNVQGKTMVGAKTQKWKVSKGTTSYILTVLGDTAAEDIKNGNFKVTGTPFRDQGCLRQQKFRLADPAEPPPCGTKAAPDAAKTEK